MSTPDPFARMLRTNTHPDGLAARHMSVSDLGYAAAGNGHKAVSARGRSAAFSELQRDMQLAKHGGVQRQASNGSICLGPASSGSMNRLPIRSAGHGFRPKVTFGYPGSERSYTNPPPAPTRPSPARPETWTAGNDVGGASIAAAAQQARQQAVAQHTTASVALSHSSAFLTQPPSNEAMAAASSPPLDLADGTLAVLASRDVFAAT